ncbi:MAG: flagellar hook protein FlgE, partial [Bacillota bacterium]|nr:flagellar hook protein FlgE [Bacillota bacterium]
MMRSLFAGVSGLRNHQIRMDVIGNNIANVNTIGFKGSRVLFRDVLYQTLAGASAPTGTRGGTNPMQVGLGVALAAIDTIHTAGSFQSTGVDTDMAVEGDGFFVVSDGLRQYYTRAGAFTVDDEGNLVAANGMRVLGWTADPRTGAINTQTAVAPIVIRRGAELAPSATTEAVFGGNIDASSPVGTTFTVPKAIYDSQGNVRQLEIVFTKTAVNTWSWVAHCYHDPATGTDDHVTAGSGTLVFYPDGRLDPDTDGAGPDTGSTGTGWTYDPATGRASATVTIVSNSGVNNWGVNDLSVRIDFTDLTQFAAETSATAVSQNGYTRGTLQAFQVDSRGVITGSFSNGRNQALAQVALALFTNPAGLTRAGNTLFEESNNSGEVQIGTAGNGGRGLIKPSNLEMSNVDLSQEFTEMIITQRG